MTIYKPTMSHLELQAIVQRLRKEPDPLAALQEQVASGRIPAKAQGALRYMLVRPLCFIITDAE